MPRRARRIRCPGIMHPSSGSLSPGTSHAMLSAPTASTCLSGSQNRGYLLDAKSVEAARALDAAVHADVAEEGQGIRLMAKRVDVGPCVLSANDDAGGPGARPCYFRLVLVLVAAVQVVGVAGLPMRGVDGHVFRAGLLEVEDARADYHAGVLTDK